MRLKKSVLCGTAGTVLVGSIGLFTLPMSSASASPSVTSQSAMGGSNAIQTGMADRRMHGHVMTGPTGNKVEMVSPDKSKYVPNIAGASDADRAKSQKLLDGVNNFCRTHTAAGLKAKWRPGLDQPGHSTHFFNPKPKSDGLKAANPKAALIYNGKLSGVMFSGMPLPSLGSIPRAHSHDMSMGMEMVHVYCYPTLKKAFTPNRMLGVRALRLKIRPAVMDLNKRQLHAVVAKVRSYTGNKLHAANALATSAKSGPDPVLQAMRTEIRRSLMVLSEPQLRSVWSLMQSY